MNTNKHYEFFQPTSVKDKIHIIGCGAIGSTLACTLARLGLTNFILYDEDFVEAKNVANQMYRTIDVGKDKVDALKEMMVEINPENANIETKGFYVDEKLDGYVFIAVDSIDVRKKIVNVNKFNQRVKAMFDFRMRLEDAQHYAADWSSIAMKDNLINSMDFTQEEADAATPRSACNEALSIYYTIMAIVAEGVNNFVHFCKDKNTLNQMVLYDANMGIDSFKRTDLKKIA